MIRDADRKRIDAIAAAIERLAPRVKLTDEQQRAYALWREASAQWTASMMDRERAEPGSLYEAVLNNENPQLRIDIVQALQGRTRQ